MTFFETALPSSGKRKFNARLYYNRVAPGVRPLVQHSHPSFEFGIFNEFHGVYTLKNRSYTIESGDIFMFRSNEEHYVTRIDGEHVLESVGLQFSPDFIWSPSDEIFDMRYMYVFAESNASFENRLARKSQTTMKIRRLLQAIESEFVEKPPEYGLMIKLNLIEILVLMIREYQVADLESLEQKMSIKKDNLIRIENAMRYIDNHISEPLSLEELAGIAKMSVSHFSQLFKKLNGFSAWDYVISKRIDMAQALLLSTDEAVLDIAFQCGFNNSTNFNRAFKKITGISPTEYRRV